MFFHSLDETNRLRPQPGLACVNRRPAPFCPRYKPRTLSAIHPSRLVENASTFLLAWNSLAKYWLSFFSPTAS